MKDRHIPTQTIIKILDGGIKNQINQDEYKIILGTIVIVVKKYCCKLLLKTVYIK